MPALRFTEAQWRQYLYSYYRLIEDADRHIGIVLDALRRSGKEENTIVIFSSDHGDGVAHQWSNKCVHYEEVARVPFIISRKGAPFAGKVDRDTLVAASVDFYATALDYAGCDMPGDCMGKSLRPVLEGRDAAHRPYVVSEIPGPSWGVDQQVAQRLFGANAGIGRMLRTPRYKYTVYMGGDHREQLYDMVEDRGEMRNLSSDPHYRRVLNDHRGLMVKWCKDIEDTQFDPYLVLPEP